MAEGAAKSLYERLGGYDAIAAATDDLLRRVYSDPQIGSYWKGHSTDSLRTERQLVVDFLAAAFGGPVLYRGRDMKTSHEGLGISERDWQAFVNIIVATLDTCGVQGKDREEFLAAASRLQGEVVEGNHSWLLADPDAFGEVMTNVVGVAKLARDLELKEKAGAASKGRRSRPRRLLAKLPGIK